MAEDRDDIEYPELVALAHKRFRESRDHADKWREEARECFDMVAGNQWDEDTLSMLEEERRPAVVFNRISRTINAIVGTQVSNRQETRYIPRELGDVQVNEIYSAASEWIRDQCDAEDEESDSFEDMLTCGMGWTETRMDYDHDPEGMGVIERIDPLEMYWDSTAKKRNISDADWVLRMTRMSPEKIEARWPDADFDSQSDPWDEGEDDDITRVDHTYPQDSYKYQQALGSGKRRALRVGHMQWCEYETVYRIGQEAETVEAEIFRKLKPKLDEAGIPYIKQQKKVWKQAFVAGGVVLEEGECPFPDGPTLKCMTYKRERNKNLWYGLVRVMKDPQKFGNKFFSQILDILNKGAKGGIIAEKDAFDDPTKAEENWARPDGIVWARPGAITNNKIQPKPLVQLPAGLDKLMQFSMDGVHDMTGVNLELLGMADRAQAGILEQHRKQAGLTIIAPLFDALRRYRKEQGRVLLHFIQNYLSDGRLIRIIGQGGNEQYIPLTRQEDSGKYDVIVDEAPTSPNMKERTFMILSELLPHLLKMGVPMPPSVLDYAPLPSKLTSEWKEMIEQAQGQANPQALQEQLQQMGQEMQKMGEENQQLKDIRAQKEEELRQKWEETQAEIQLKREEAQAEIDLKRAELEAELQLEREKAAADVEMQRAKAEQDIAMQRQKISGDFQIAQWKNRADNDLKQGEALSKAYSEALEKGDVIKQLMDGGSSVKVERGEDGSIVGATIEKTGGSRRIQVIRDENGDIVGAETVQ